jgi:hypothetical protein
MGTRWAFHRSATPLDEVPHLDMLPPARRLWGAGERADPAAARSCTLGALERSVLDFHRIGDVPGFEIPSRYFRFLRTADAAAIDGVLAHNRHDVVSLAALTAHALWLAQEGPLACREAGEQLGLGGLYERAGDRARAGDAYEMAVRTGDVHVRRAALARLALLLRREARHADAAGAWESVFELACESCGPASPLARRAAEALAIHHEHRARDLDQARRYAEMLRRHAAGRAAAAAGHRLIRLDRKIGVRAERAPLLLGM